MVQPGGSSAGAIERIRQLLQLDRNAQALEAAGAELATHPDDPDVLELASIAARRLGRLEEAVALAEQAVAAGPDDDAAHGVLADAQLTAGHVDQAVRTAYRAVELRPGHWLHHVRYAQCLMAHPRGRETAWLAAQRAVELAPGESIAHHMIADVAYGKGMGTPEQLAIAEAALREALRLSPENAGLLNDLARVRLARSDNAAALKGFADAVVTDPTGVGAVALRNLRLVLRRVVVIQTLITLAGIVVSSGLAGPNPSIGSRLAVVVLALGLTGFIVLRWRTVLGGASARIVIPQVFRGARRLTAAFTSVALAIAAMILGVFLPGEGFANAMGAAAILSLVALLCA